MTQKLDDMAYMRGRDDARCGLPRFPQCQHPDQYGAYNAGFADWAKLQAFPAMLAALEIFARLPDAMAALARACPDRWREVDAAITAARGEG